MPSSDSFSSSSSPTKPSTRAFFHNPLHTFKNQTNSSFAGPSEEKSEYGQMSPLLPPPGGVGVKADEGSNGPSGDDYFLPSSRKNWGLGGRGRKRLGLIVWVLILCGIGVGWRVSSSPNARNKITSGSTFGSLGMAGTGTQDWPFPKGETDVSPSPLIHPGSREIDLASDPLPLNVSLADRLLFWERSPGGRGPGVHLGLDGESHEEVELGTFNDWNLESCSNNDHQLNTHMIRFSVNVWSTMNRTTIATTRARLIDYMRNTVLAQGLHLKMGKGRGIVMVAGNADTFQRVVWSVKYMRSKGTTLPVQVYHFPDEALPPDHTLRTELQELGVELVEASGQTRDQGKTKSYHLKAIAVVDSPWKEVLYLDSDSIPIKDPEYMFHSPSYLRTRFWATPDYWRTSANNAIWPILGVRCRDEWEMEAGQIFVDKEFHLDVFLLTRFMLEHHKWFFFFSDGDKDVFRWALLALRKRWGVPGRWVGAAALPRGTASGDHCGHSMIQHDAWGAPLFVHYNLMKQIPSGVGRGFSWGKTKHLPLFNAFPPQPSHARQNEHSVSDLDLELRGLGDVDCDMLADSDLEGNARSPAREEVRRRAVRERGVKAGFHGGWISALCIDLNYQDPRPKWSRDADEADRKSRRERFDREWDARAEALREDGKDVPERPEWKENFTNPDGSIRPDWESSPIELVWWRDMPDLKDFEGDLYDTGFVPNGKGF